MTFKNRKVSTSILVTRNIMLFILRLEYSSIRFGILEMEVCNKGW